MRSHHIFMLLAFILQVNLSTAFLAGLLSGLFGGGPQYGVPQYAPMPQQNQQLPQQGQQGQQQAWPTTNIAGAFDHQPRIGIVGAVASIIDGVIRATGNILAALGGGGPFTYGAMIPPTNNNGTQNGNHTGNQAANEAEPPAEEGAE